MQAVRGPLTPPPIASAKLQVCAAALAVCVGLGDTNSGPRTWEANISPTEPSPQPPFHKECQEQDTDCLTRL